MKKIISLTIPLGFRLIDKIENVKVWQAEQYLLSKRYRRYTKAVRMDDDAYLHARYLVCPYCGKQFAANSNSDRFLEASKMFRVHGYRVPKEKVREWATMQLSLLDEGFNKELLISSAVEPSDAFICPDCGHASRASASERKVELVLDRKKVIVKCEVAEIDEIMSLKWARENNLRISFPAYEVLTFDLSRGRVYVKLEDVCGVILCQRDITSTPEALSGGAAYKVLDRSKIVMRNVGRLFRDAWEDELPYTAGQIDLSALFKMTMFVGYPASFYVCVPFAQGTYAVEKSFRLQARKLHLAKNINKVYQQTSLPQIKSVRRVMFENPGLFFYVDEIHGVWTALKDHNLFCRFLKCGNIYEILSSIHLRPGALTYMADYCSVKGAISMVDWCEKNWDYVRKQAIDYCCMSISMRAQVQEYWKHKRAKVSAASRLPEYSLPMCSPDESIRDCSIDGYYFFWLRSSNEYARAADRLKNCLDGWQLNDFPVVCVRKGDRLRAAIEVREGHVAQARGFSNQPIEDDRHLYAAFQKWMKKYRLEWMVDGYGIDGEIDYLEVDDWIF